MLEKIATMKSFEYLPLGKELKIETDNAKTQYQKLDDTYEFDKIIKVEKPTFKKYNRSNLIYNSKYSFYEYCNIKNIYNFSLKSNYPILLSFYSDLNQFNNLNPQKESTKEKKATVYDNASDLSNEYLKIYFDEYKILSDAKKESWVINMIPLIDYLKHNIWLENEESTEITSKKSDKDKSLDLFTCHH